MMLDHNKEVEQYKEELSEEDDEIEVIRGENVMDFTEGATSESDSEKERGVMEGNKVANRVQDTREGLLNKLGSKGEVSLEIAQA